MQLISWGVVELDMQALNEAGEHVGRDGDSIVLKARVDINVFDSDETKIVNWQETSAIEIIQPLEVGVSSELGFWLEAAWSDKLI